MAPRRKFDHDAARSRYRDGETASAIAASVGVCQHAVYYALFRDPTYAPHLPPSGPRLVARKFDRDEARALLASGLTKREVGDRLGVNRRAIGEALRDPGALRKPRRFFDVDKAAAMLASGMTRYAVARALGFAWCTVDRHFPKLTP